MRGSIWEDPCRGTVGHARSCPRAGPLCVLGVDLDRFDGPKTPQRDLKILDRHKRKWRIHYYPRSKLALHVVLCIVDIKG